MSLGQITKTPENGVSLGDEDTGLSFRVELAFHLDMIFA